ncbi:MAG: pyrroline-5-carboxylate reductase [Candidatus Magasanikbacteria bacterium RIFCSPHIGHO2_02_FULL_47_14]|uniref:Pyrroline-5-carboxylate reductase n=1 Tax=Candidatus Magasanikbacteria bacterium RIFCSPHIGHO2_02_FULL_47_14 TaxID=1798680 RepID=A0A1F6MB10_9BACT|nr:MAG: pyrroline-5-carboxylate reductase [Candidatus Magasanikbacteria bacterium RIFCSPHIGHO2_02_FULL_47_14]
MKIGLIGAGNMGGAIYRALVQKFSPEDIFVCDHSQEKLDALGVTHGFTKVTDMLPQVDVVLLGVKPQTFAEIHLDLSDKLVISIMAGISLGSIAAKTGAARVVRSMPNLPAQVGQGLTGWVANENVTGQEKDLVQEIFTSFGKEIEVNEEAMVDVITALSGCGPAYFFYLTELLQEKALTLGLSSDQARIIAETTFVGAAHLLEKNTKTAKEWREAVSSKGGVTVAALSHLQKQKFDVIFDQAIDAAIRRSQELKQ